MSNTPMGLVVSMLCAEDDPRQMCRRLVSLVNHGPMHLTRVVATGMQIYPVSPELYRGSSALLRCEFRMRRTGAPVSDADVQALLERLGTIRVLDAHLVDAAGVNLGPATRVATAG